MAQETSGDTVLRVVDVLDHPHGGRIYRLRVQSGEPPTVRGLKGATLSVRGPRGEERTFRVNGFALIGGKPSNDRIRRTGRIDLIGEEEGEGPPVDLTWTARLQQQ